MNVTAADRRTIRSVIEQQLIALQTDDAETAFALASPDIQAKFVTAANFLYMVKVAYPAVYRPRSVMFETLVLVQDIPAQEVFLLAPDGTLMKAIYLMQKQLNGAWKIDGCFLEVSQDSDPAK